MPEVDLDPQDKAAWCRWGEDAEIRLAGPLLPNGGALMRNPAKASDPYTHDLFVVLPADLKTIRTRFRTADRYGIDPRSAVTINRKDLERYARLYPTIVILLDVDYGDYKRFCSATLTQIRELVRSGRSRLHVYRDRVADTAGNARDSYVFDAEWFSEL